MKILWLLNLPETFRLNTSKIIIYMYMYVYQHFVFWSNMSHICSHTQFQEEGMLGFPGATSSRKKDAQCFLLTLAEKFLGNGNGYCNPKWTTITWTPKRWASVQPHHSYCSAGDIFLGQPVPVCTSFSAVRMNNMPTLSLRLARAIRWANILSKA